MRTRPYFSRISPYSYKPKGGSDPVPGIGLFRGRELSAHLTASEALELADKLVDLAESLEGDK